MVISLNFAYCVTSMSYKDFFNDLKDFENVSTSGSRPNCQASKDVSGSTQTSHFPPLHTGLPSDFLGTGKGIPEATPQ